MNDDYVEKQNNYNSRDFDYNGLDDSDIVDLKRVLGT